MVHQCDIYTRIETFMSEQTQSGRSVRIRTQPHSFKSMSEFSTALIVVHWKQSNVLHHTSSHTS